MKLPEIQASGSGLRSTTSSLAEINVVPLIDIMLVLLIVFMISAPMMQQGASVDLPKANTGALPDLTEQLVLEVSDKKAISLNGDKVPKGELFKRVLALSTANPDIQVFIKADTKVDYGFVAQIIAEVKRANVTKVGLVTLPTQTDLNL